MSICALRALQSPGTAFFGGGMINSTSGAKRVRDSRGGWYIIISPVSDDTAHQSGYLDKKVGQSAGVPDLLGCQAGRHKCAALQIEADVQFAPYLAGLRQPVLLPHPLAATVDTKPCAVQNQPDRITGCQGVECDLKRWCTPAKRRKIRHGEVRLHEPQQTADKALRLPERQAEHGAQGQAGLNRQIRISLLTTALAGAHCAPPSNRVFAEPHRLRHHAGGTPRCVRSNSSHGILLTQTYPAATH